MGGLLNQPAQYYVEVIEDLPHEHGVQGITYSQYDSNIKPYQVHFFTVPLLINNINNMIFLYNIVNYF
jgi:hypothetical protein